MLSSSHPIISAHHGSDHMYELELERVATEVYSRGARRVLLQVPDGMRPLAFQIAEYLGKAAGVEVVLSGDSCYGACDLATRQASETGTDLLVHYGHAPFLPEAGFPTIYVEAKIPVDVVALVDAVLPYVAGWRSVGLTSTIQHTGQLGEIAKALGKRKVRAFIGKGTGTTPEDGQVLGCRYSAATNLPEEVDGYIFVGGGRFHPLGLALTSGKPVLVANPYNGSVSLLGESELMQLAKRRAGAVSAASRAKAIGVLVSSKPGQMALEMGKELSKRLRERGIASFVIYLDEVRADTLNNFTEPEAFVDTACPRIAIDGVAGVDRPILTTVEARVVLGEARWEEVWGPGYLG